MDNITRRGLLTRHRQSQFPGSILDVFKAYDQGVDLIGEFEQQQMQVAQTPQEQQQGLRPAHQAGDVNQSMTFPNVPPNTPFNTMGMKAPIDIKKFDEQGHLVKSYDNVPPGVQNLPTGPQRGTVIETPARMQNGGPVKPQTAPRVPTQDTPVRSESRNLDNDSTYNVKGWMAAGRPGGIDPGDGEFHGASVDPYTGMWLKSKNHPTAWKEHLHSQLSPDPFFKENMSVVNPEGHFGENQLQYVPRKKQQNGGFKGSDLESAMKVGAGAAVTSTIGRGISALAKNRNLDKDAFAQWKAGQDRAHQALLGMDYDEYCLTGDCPENPFQGDPPNFKDWRNHDYFSASQTNARPVGRLVQGFEDNPLQGKSILKQGVRDGILTGALTYGTNKLLDNTRFGRKVKRNFNVKVGWNGRRLAGGPRKMQSGSFAFDSELLKAGIAGTESSNGVRSQMINPGSTATGLYGQRFSEIKDTYPNSRSEFSTNMAAQDSIFDKRLYEGLNGEKSMLDHLDHMYTNYADQIEKKGHTSNHVGGIINMLGREGTRRYYGLVVRDGKSLEEVFPTKYGPKAEIKNKTPDEYADSMQKWIDRYKEENCKGEECGEKKLGGSMRKYFKLRK